MASATFIIVPQPYGLTFTAWSALVAEQLAQYGVGQAFNELEWKAWVCALFYIPELAARNIPAPEQFDTWVVWAERFVESVMK